MESKNLLKTLPEDKPLSKRSQGLHMSRKKADKGKLWTDRDKLKAIAAYAVSGNASRVEELTGIPSGTINYWKTLPWWYEEMEKLRQAEDEELTSQYTKIIKKTIEKLADKLDLGDEVVLKDGRKVRVELHARVLNNIIGTLSDSRNRLRENSNFNPVKVLSVSDRLRQLEDQFVKFATSKVVNGEVISKVIEITQPEIKDENETKREIGTESRGEEGSQDVEEPASEGRSSGSQAVQEGQEVNG